MNTKEQSPTIEDALKELASAEECMKHAQEAEDDARRVATDCRNRLNRAQKNFDSAVASVRERAHPGSDWSSRDRRGVAA